MLNIDLGNLSVGTFIAVYFAGVITSLTPCVYPIIPIVIGCMGSFSGSVGARIRGAVFYVVGLALVYTALGMIAALTGKMFGSLTTNPYVYLGFGIMVLALGGNMMDWYYIPLPGLGGSTAVNDKPSFFTPFFMGVSSGLVASPCTAPVLGGLLLLVATKKAIISGGLLLFMFSLGMSTLLLVLGFSCSFLAFLPKSGNWMVKIKKALALLLIAGGIYFIFKAGQLY
ncbi:MAG: sulfite exporter TauE/SafE family protein [Elusimicrobia bacterium]|nr:sulfite exporter TauE/SafE family protein [Candidatus Liberimonas magnetica]